MTSRGEARTLLGEFLRVRRGQLTREQVGLPPFARARRVPGLRREEVAELAGVSTDYYTRLEQGRFPPPSDSVLHAIADALKLDDHQRAYLRELAAHGHERTELSGVQPIPRQISELLEGINLPAVALDPIMNVLAWNAAGAAFFIDFSQLARSERNLVRLMFFNDHMRARFPGWETATRVAAGMLRMRAARTPDDPRLHRLIEELCEFDNDFRQWWNTQHVLAHSASRRTYWHPVAGTMELEWSELSSSVQPELSIVVLTAANAKSRLALQRLQAPSLRSHSDL